MFLSHVFQYVPPGESTSTSGMSWLLYIGVGYFVASVIAFFGRYMITERPSFGLRNLARAGLFGLSKCSGFFFAES
jgi:hypothetical protein